MKLISILLESQFNSLQPFKTIDISHHEREDKKIDPVCLIGVNGSGKSNLLELIAEAFYYLELDNRFNQTKKSKTKASKRLELIYKLKKHGNKQIKIDTISSPFARLFVKDNTDTWEEILKADEILKYLPEKIVGYTSGMNETLSFRFNQLDDIYSQQVLENARDNSRVILPDNRLIFLDNESNEAIVVSNFLFNTEKELKVFDDLLRINGVDKFKIIINLKRKGGKGYVILSRELLGNIEKLKMCSVCYKEDAKKYYELDFLNNKETRKAFEGHFGSIYKLFMAFQKFKLLNPINLDKSQRVAKTENDILDNKPTLAKTDKVFRFEELYLNISKPDKSIPYIGISDGEHQFIQIVGATMIFEQEDILFLFDEPETHFNPNWRTQFIKVLNEKLQNRDQDIVITTHSPYIVSDCKDYRVYKFSRKNDKVSFEKIGITTYGTSFDVILKKAFDIDSTISGEVESEIDKLLKSGDAGLIEKFIEDSGPSFEKLALLKRLAELKK